MTWQTIAYFSSIVITCLLTGFLAWYAWKQGPQPVMRHFAWLTFSESLLALTEILSMLSTSEAVARFWFNTRYLFFAIIPVLFLIFALGYHNHKRRYSRLFLAGLCTIPCLTQVFLWTNSLHGLWMEREVGFLLAGPFWIADINLRIPAVWFLVHSFYALFVTMAGIVILMVAAWGRRKALLWQPLLLSAGVLVAMVSGSIAAFNLVTIEYNPSIPGIGISSLFYGFAILGTKFLRRPPISGEKTTSAIYGQENRALVFFLLLFLLLVSGIATGGYLSYRKFEQDFRKQAYDQLSAVASLKVNDVQRWWGERLADGEVFLHNPAFSSLVQRVLEEPEDMQANTELMTWLETTSKAYQYSHLYLLTPAGRILIASPDDDVNYSKHLLEELQPLLQAGVVDFWDFHRHPDGNIRLGVMVPILSTLDDSAPLGLLVMEIDPATYLYPYLNEWPGSSETSETLLVRLDGDHVLFLNPLRFDPQAALNLRFPLTNTDLPAVRAVLGESGVVEGVDYREVEVLASLAPVPDTPWFIVARMDAAEIYSPLQARLWQTLIFFSALILSTGTGFFLILRRQRINFYRTRYESAEALRESEEKFSIAFQNIPYALVITTLTDGKIIEANESFFHMSGFSREESLGKTTIDLNLWGSLPDRSKLVEVLQKQHRVKELETRFRRKSGELFTGLISSELIRLLGQGCVLNVINDITERRQMEEKIIVSEARYRRLFEAARDGILILDAETGLIVDANPYLSEILGSTHDEICGKKIWDLGFFNDIVANQDNFLELQQKEYIRYEDLPLKTTGGRRIDVEFVSNVYQVNHQKVIQCNIRDIAARKRAEVMLHMRLELFEYARSHSLEELLVHTLDGIGELTASPIGFYHFVDEDQQNLSLQTCSTRTQREFCQAEGKGRHYPIAQAGIWADCIKTRSPVIHNDYPTGPGRKRLPKGHAVVLRELAVPILRGGKIVAILGIGNKPSEYSREDVDLATYFADIAWEIAEGKRAEEAIKTYSEKLEEVVEERTKELREAQEKIIRQEKLATLGQIAGSIGHELRNPLGVISNAIYYLKLSQPEAKESVLEYLEIIEAETRKSEKIIADLLDFTRSKAAIREIEAVNGMIQRVVERYPPPSSVEVLMKIPANLPKVMVDPAQVEQVLGNLIINAYQSMPEGGKMTISARVSKERVSITIKDTGIGIPAENMKKLFEPLFTTRSRGIGLGLAVSRKLVEANEGRIEVKSELGKGSTFTIMLPKIKEEK